MTTDLSTATAANSTSVNQVHFEAVHVGGAHLQLNDTAGDYAGWYGVSVHALLPEYFEDDSRIGLEAEFSLSLPSDAVTKGEWLMSWVSLPTYETVWDETTETDTTVTTNYSLACAIQAGMDAAMVMNFEGSGSMWAADNAGVSLEETNSADQVSDEPNDESGTTSARRMLKGKRRAGGKRKARRGKKKARKQRRRFNGKQKKQAQRRARKAWRSEMSREARTRRSLDDTTAGTTTSTDADASYATYCYNEDGTACTFSELVDATSLCDATNNQYASAMCDGNGYPYRGEICALAD